MKICKNCQNELTDNAKFCNKCGTQVDEGQTGVVFETQAKTNTKIENPLQNKNVSEFLSWIKNRLLDLRSSQSDDNVMFSIISLATLFLTMFISLFNIIGKKIFYMGMKTASIFSSDGLKLSDLKDSYKMAREGGLNMSSISTKVVTIIFIALFTGIIIVAITNYLTTRDNKKFIIALANKTVFATIISVLAFLLSIFAYFQFKSSIAILLVLLAFIQVSMAIQEILFTNNFGKRIKVYIAMIYTFIIYLIVMGVFKSIFSSFSGMF